VRFASRYGLDAAIGEIETQYRELVGGGVTPISAGGDHSISYPILKALGASEPVGLVHVDAHCDTMVPLHGGPSRASAPA
jgi:agmatinase